MLRAKQYCLDKSLQSKCNCSSYGMFPIALIIRVEQHESLDWLTI